MNICILIPAHNEEQAIGQIVDRIRSRKLDVVVVDDGSSDRTALMARDNGAFVIRLEHKGGKGNALQKGFAYIIKEGYEALITMDGDGQHAVDDIQKLIDRQKETGAAIVNGNRMQSHRGMPLVRLATNWIMSSLISLVCGQSIPDTQCGFRLIKTDVLRAIQLSSSDFEIESEILIKASRRKFQIVSAGVQTIYGNEVSKINPILDTIRFIKYIFRELTAKKN